ncbi:MAG: NADH-quinone oxidoreductase subunit C, partial [Cyclobacteriaceae bacterium]|nr:NADH-quinone oxidoreductase subunit C [Cyclobacteriaceae bacterium]
MEKLKEEILKIVPEAVITEDSSPLEVTVPATQLYVLGKALRENTDSPFDFLYCQTGVDWPEYMTVVYHLRSTISGLELVVKAKIDDREKPEIESVCDIWRTA